MRRRRLLRKQPQVRIESKHVAICVPMMDMCHSAFAVSLANMMARTLATFRTEGAKLDLTLVPFTMSIIANSRHILVNEAIKIGATHILWLDSDMTFPQDTLLRFMRHDHPIIAANCMARKPPYNLTARNENGEQIYTTTDSTGLEKVARFGLACAFMSIDVFKKIDPPWFDHRWLPEMQLHSGEDFALADRISQAGIAAYIDHDLSKEVMHIGQAFFNPTQKKREGME